MIWFSAVFSAEIARSYPKDRGPKNQQFFLMFNLLDPTEKH